MPEIFVSSRKYDPKSILRPSENATRQSYYRITDPEISELSVVAQWLVSQVKNVLRGGYTPLERRVYIFNGLTEAENRLEQAVGDDAKERAKGLSLAHDEHKKEQKCEYSFSIIEPHQTDAQYWNSEVTKIAEMSTGEFRTVKIRIGLEGGAEYNAQPGMDLREEIRLRELMNKPTTAKRRI